MGIVKESIFAESLWDFIWDCRLRRSVSVADRGADTSGAEGYRFEPYRAYHRINNLARWPLSSRRWGQIGDKFSTGWDWVGKRARLKGDTALMSNGPA